MPRQAMISLALLLATLTTRGLPAADDLDGGFANPPDAAAPWVYWWWLDSNASKEGITRDLEEMKRQGIGGALVFDAGLGGTSPVGPKFMSDAWRELFKHAAREADRLDLKLSFNICSGWNCGGAWVPPEHALKKVVWSESRVNGPSSFSEVLAKPPIKGDYHKDIAVLALRLPKTLVEDRLAMENASAKLTASSTYKAYTTALALDRSAASRWISNGDKPGMGPTESKPEFLQFEFPEPFAAAGLFIAPYPDCGPRDCQGQTSPDGKTFQTVRHLILEQQKPQTVTFDEVREGISAVDHVVLSVPGTRELERPDL